MSRQNRDSAPSVEIDDDEDEAPRRGNRREGKGNGKGRGEDRSGGRRRRTLFGTLFYWSCVLGVWAFIGLTGFIVYCASGLPHIDQLALPKRPPNIAILAEDGTLLANRGDTGGPALRLGDMPAYLPAAFIAIEDRRFYAHWGIDPLGIGRAVFRNVAHRGGSVEGGSTLTQQLAKNLFLTQERTITRKIQEAILALWLEHKYSKDQILELYLNRMYFGSGAYGVEAASQKYFSHSARAVTLPEAALLAGLMKAPTRLAPNRNPSGAADRAANVITAMAEQGLITEAMAKSALARPATAVSPSGAGSINYVADYVMDVLDSTIGAIDDDITVTTTLDPRLQAAAERALTGELDRSGRKFGVSQGAFVALDPSGGIKALIGGRSYSDSQFNRAIAAKRQPGSTFKPFVYLTALEHGLTPDSVRQDSPIDVKGWRPEDSSRSYLGPVTLTRALAMSLNTVAVRLVLEVGPRAVIATAHRLGILSDLQPNASIALGTSEVTPLELVSAYVPFANGGIGIDDHIITKVRDADGHVLYQRHPFNVGRIVEPTYVAMMNTMMQETLLTGTAHAAAIPDWQAAGKTGTSQDYRDAWFVGYTSALIAGVWLGNDDSSPTKRTSGANLPASIWNQFMREALRGTPPQPLPSGSWRTDPSLPVAQVAFPASGPSATLQPAATSGPAGAPMNLGPGQTRGRANATRSPDATGTLSPPGLIPHVGEDDRSPLQRLFGG